MHTFGIILLIFLKCPTAQSAFDEFGIAHRDFILVASFKSKSSYLRGAYREQTSEYFMCDAAIRAISHGLCLGRCQHQAFEQRVLHPWQ